MHLEEPIGQGREMAKYFSIRQRSGQDVHWKRPQKCDFKEHLEVWQATALNDLVSAGLRSNSVTLC